MDLWYIVSMQRAVLTKKDREQFFNNLLEKSKVSLNSIAPRYGISGRTLRDWRRGKFLSSVEKLEAIANDFNLKLPPFKTRSQHWYAIKGARKGALARMALYGPPGTPEGRKKGGLVSQRNRRENPEKYRVLGCLISKTFLMPDFSKELAELCGILLGDGAITDTQIRVTLNRFTDRKYAFFVAKLMERIIGEKPSKYIQESTVELCLSGVELVKLFEKLGLKRGNKVAQQVNIPKWILKNKIFALSCLRGLVDTDGGVYTHNHVVGGKRYLHFGLCFTSASKPMLDSVHKIFISVGIKAKVQGERRIYIYDMKEVFKYFKIVGSNNPKHKKRLKKYLKIKRQKIIT